MSKALLIKGSDFSVNKCGTVHYLVTVPCESIALDQTALTLNTLDSQILTATVTPADTTDAVEWASSDETVATVEDGLVTVRGLGTVTITATCGEQSATCAISVDNIELTGFEFGSATNMRGDDNFATGNVPDNYKNAYYADKIPLNSTRLRLSRSSAFVGDFNLAPALLPNNVGSVRFTSADVSGMYHLLLYNSKQESTLSACAAIVAKTRQYAPSNGAVDVTMNVPSEADSFTMGLTYKTQYSEKTDLSEVVSEKGTKVVLMRDIVNES